MARKNSIARVVDSTSSIEEIDAQMQKSQESQICLREKSHKARKDCLLDFGSLKVTGDEIKDEKQRINNQKISKIKKSKKDFDIQQATWDQGGNRRSRKLK